MYLHSWPGCGLRASQTLPVTCARTHLADFDLCLCGLLQPVPSLTQCYKYNQEACCVAGHDTVIKTGNVPRQRLTVRLVARLTRPLVQRAEYDAMWSPSCQREYANLELLFCLGCNLDQVGCSVVPTSSPHAVVT